MTYIHLSLKTSLFRLSCLLLTLIFFFTSSVAPIFAARSYTYDANGNMTSNGENCYEYNEANKLKIVRNCSNNKIIADYIYDFKGNRIVKKQFNNGSLQKTIYSPEDSFEKTKLASNSAIENTTYYMANDEVVAKKNPDGSKTYYHSDHLGSNSVLTNQNGDVVEKTSYEPYGEIKVGGNLSKFQYTGQEKDSETGLNYYDARYYDPHIHRFTQPDMLLPDAYDPQQLNRYAYVRNNPIKYTDPSGNFIVLAPLVWWGVAAFLGTAAVYTATPQGQQTTKTAISSSVKAVQNLGSQIANAVASGAKQATNLFNKPSAPNNPSRNTQTNNPTANNPKPPQMNPMQKIGPAIPIAANNVLQQIRENGGKALEGYASGVYKNVTEPYLPQAGRYLKHDIFPYTKGVMRQAERLVIDTVSGKTWYTPDHYKTWIPFVD